MRRARLMKWIAVCLAAGVLTGGLTACGQNNDNSRYYGSAEEEKLPFIYGEKTIEKGKFIISCEGFVENYQNIFNEFLKRAEKVDHATVTQTDSKKAEYSVSIDDEEPTVTLVFSQGDKTVTDPSKGFDKITVLTTGRRIDDDTNFAYAMYMILLSNNNEQKVSEVTNQLDKLLRAANKKRGGQQVATDTFKDGMDYTLNATYKNMSFVVANHKEEEKKKEEPSKVSPGDGISLTQGMD